MRYTAIIVATFLSSCAGYHLGGNKPAALANVHTINVPMFKNDTLHPRAGAIATSAFDNALVQDGTYRIANSDQADAILEGTIHKIDYSNIRAQPLDTIRPEELQNTITIEWTLRDARNPLKVLMYGSSKGISRFFVDSNLQTSRNNTLPDALQRAGQAIVSKLANGF